MLCSHLDQYILFIAQRKCKFLILLQMWNQKTKERWNDCKYLFYSHCFINEKDIESLMKEKLVFEKHKNAKNHLDLLFYFLFGPVNLKYFSIEQLFFEFEYNYSNIFVWCVFYFSLFYVFCYFIFIIMFVSFSFCHDVLVIIFNWKMIFFVFCFLKKIKIKLN